MQCRKKRSGIGIVQTAMRRQQRHMLGTAVRQLSRRVHTDPCFTRLLGREAKHDMRILMDYARGRLRGLALKSERWEMIGDLTSSRVKNSFMLNV